MALVISTGVLGHILAYLYSGLQGCSYINAEGGVSHVADQGRTLWKQVEDDSSSQAASGVRMRMVEILSTTRWAAPATM